MFFELSPEAQSFHRNKKRLNTPRHQLKIKQVFGECPVRARVVVIF